MAHPMKPPRTEHERKFLVVVPKLPHRLPKPKRLVQGYLTHEPLQSRVRITDGKSAIHEFKGPDDLEIPTGRFSPDEAEFLLEHYRIGGLIEKARHVFPTGIRRTFADGAQELVWELDVFEGENAPLHLAEIELPSRTAVIPKGIIPSWIGKEVTGDERFKNRNLSLRPFATWKKREKAEILALMGL